MPVLDSLTTEANRGSSDTFILLMNESEYEILHHSHGTLQPIFILQKHVHSFQDGINKEQPAEALQWKKNTDNYDICN